MIRLALCVVLVVSSGCVSTVPVLLDRSVARGDTLTVASLDRRLADKRIAVQVNDGRTIDALFDGI